MPPEPTRAEPAPVNGADDAPAAPEAGQPTASYFAETLDYQPTVGPAPEALLIPGYEIQGVLGRGGMGIVYRARQVKADRIVAVKLMLQAEQMDLDRRQRFDIEAQAIARLQHPNIVQVFEVGEVGGMPFFSLEYVDGGSLAERIKRSLPPPTEAATILMTLARAVAFFHQHNIIHRDLKPSNILLTRDGNAKVTDFGLARKLESEAHLTQTGLIFGTPSYMPPEQAGGDPQAIGPAADVYALGAILYEMLTGRAPFMGGSLWETVEQVRTRPPVAPRDLRPTTPLDLETICLKCLEKDPSRRYASADVLADDLQRFLEHLPILARPVGRVERALRWCRRNPGPAISAAAVIVSLLVGALVALYFALDARESAHVADTEKLKAESESEQSRRHLLTSRRQLYAADLNLALRAWEDGRMDRLRELLAGQMPERTGGVDLRAFEWYYLDRLAHGDLLTIKVSNDELVSAGFSPNGRRIAGASRRDNTVHIWDTVTGEDVLPLKGQSKPSLAVAWSSDGKQLAASSEDRAIRIWDAETGDLRLAMAPQEDAVVSIDFSPDGKHLAGAVGNSIPGRIKVWNTTTGDAFLTPPDQDHSYHHVRYDPTGKYVAAISHQHVTLWEAPTGRKVWSVDNSAASGHCLAFTPDGKRFGTSGKGGHVSLCETATGKQVLSFQAHKTPVSDVQFSPDGQLLATASREDGAIRIWESPTEKPPLLLRGHLYGVAGIRFSHDSRRLASWGQEGELKIWEVGVDPVVLSLPGHKGMIYRMAFTPDAAILASCSADRTVRLWDVRSGRVRVTLTDHAREITDVAISPDGRWLASASMDMTVRVWDLPALLRGGRPSARVIRGHEFEVIHLAFSADSQWIVTTSYTDGPRALQTPEPLHALKVWNVASGEELKPFAGNTKPCTCVAASPDGRWVASGTQGLIQVWDVATRQESRRIETPESGEILTLAFSNDSTRLAAGVQSSHVKVWDIETGSESVTLKGHKRLVQGLTFLERGNRLVGAGDLMKISDLETGQEIFSLPGEKRLAASKDGNWLAACGPDNTVRVWNATPWTDEVKSQRRRELTR